MIGLMELAIYLLLASVITGLLTFLRRRPKFLDGLLVVFLVVSFVVLLMILFGLR